MTRLLAVLLACLGGAASADPLEGLWVTSRDSRGLFALIEMVPCGEALCGTLVGTYGPGGTALPSRHVGREVVWGAQYRGRGTYRARAYSPTRDQDYYAQLVLSGDSVVVSGCVLGQCRLSGIWRRVD